MTDDCQNCAGCRMSMEAYCAAGAPPELCGLCHLMGPDYLVRYLQTWQPAKAAPKETDSEEQAA